MRGWTARTKTGRHFRVFACFLGNQKNVWLHNQGDKEEKVKKPGQNFLPSPESDDMFISEKRRSCHPEGQPGERHNRLQRQGLLGNSVMVAQLTLDQLVGVRVPVPQFFISGGGIIPQCPRLARHAAVRYDDVFSVEALGTI